MCGTCCIEISISSPIYLHHPEGKPAGVKCGWLNDNGLCDIFGSPNRPAVCSSFQADEEICGKNHEEATKLIRWYEAATS